MNATSPDHRSLFRAKVAEVIDLAKAKLPESAGRLDAAMKIVLSGDLKILADGYRARVYSQSNGIKSYELANGSCTCQDFAQAPGNLCKHRLSWMLQTRASQLTQTALETAATETASEPHTDAKEAEKVQDVSIETPDEHDAPLTSSAHKNGVSAPTVPPEYVVWIQNKPFVKFAGLLQMAHEQHLVELSECWTYNDAELSLAHAVAMFKDGRRFEGSGDASPTNVTKKVAPHFRRVALTRAKSRALRNALNIDMVAVEELGEID